jgi:hypothetical protein
VAKKFVKPVKLGEVAVVENKKAWYSASKEYYSVYVMLRGVPVEIMMTPNDLKRLNQRAKKNPEDMPKLEE